jgi:hypothetical protein
MDMTSEERLKAERQFRNAKRQLDEALDSDSGNSHIFFN